MQYKKTADFIVDAALFTSVYNKKEYVHWKHRMLAKHT